MQKFYFTPVLKVSSFQFGRLTLDFQPFAFDVVTNVAIEYLQDLGRTLTTYLNNIDQRKKFTEEEMILHMLDLNSVQGLEELEMYIKDDIERYGTKLEDCHRRLKRFLTELLVHAPHLWS